MVLIKNLVSRANHVMLFSGSGTALGFLDLPELMEIISVGLMVALPAATGQFFPAFYFAIPGIDVLGIIELG